MANTSIRAPAQLAESKNLIITNWYWWRHNYRLFLTRHPSSHCIIAGLLYVHVRMIERNPTDGISIQAQTLTFRTIMRPNHQKQKHQKYKSWIKVWFMACLSLQRMILKLIESDHLKRSCRHANKVNLEIDHPLRWDRWSSPTEGKRVIGNNTLTILEFAYLKCIFWYVHAVQWSLQPD